MGGLDSLDGGVAGGARATEKQFAKPRNRSLNAYTSGPRCGIVGAALRSCRGDAVWIPKSPFSGRFSAVLLVLAFLAPLAASPRRAGGSHTAQQRSTPAKVAADSPRITPGGTSFKFLPNGRSPPEKTWSFCNPPSPTHTSPLSTFKPLTRARRFLLPGLHTNRNSSVRSGVASRKNDDGTTSFITIDPGTAGFEFVVGDRAGKRVLVIRDGQHEYTFTETA